MFQDAIPGTVDLDAVQKLAEMLHIDIASCAIIGAFIAVVIAVLKQHLSLTGKNIMILAAILALVLNFCIAIALESSFADLATWSGIIIGALISWVIPVGGWSGLKQLAHKVGTPS